MSIEVKKKYTKQPYWKEICATYKNMQYRCYNKKNNRFYLYGERGIKVCGEWLNEESGKIAFYEWAIANGYQKGLTIDRIDVNGDYEPKNCRWANAKEQARNRTNTVYVAYAGENILLLDLAERYGIKYATLRKRLLSGWDIDIALTTKPITGRNQIGQKERLRKATI